MVIIIFGTDQIFKDKATWWAATCTSARKGKVEVVHRPTAFLDVIHNGSKALFWARYVTILKNSENSEDSIIFDFSLLDYLWEAEKSHTNSPEFQKNIMRNIKPSYMFYLADDTENHDSLVDFLHSLGVPFFDVTEAVKLA